MKWKDEKIKYDFITNTAMMWVLGMLGGVHKLRWQDKVGVRYWNGIDMQIFPYNDKEIPSQM